MPSYHTLEYWNLRYFDELEPFEWYCSFDDLADQLRDLFQREGATNVEIMDLGCGTSQLAFDIAANFARANVLAVDGSEQAIRFMEYLNEMDRPDRQSSSAFSSLHCLTPLSQRTSSSTKSETTTHPTLKSRHISAARTCAKISRT